MNDITILIEYLGGPPFTDRTGRIRQAPALGDVNCDGKVTNGDVVYMIRAIYGHEVGFDRCYR